MHFSEYFLLFFEAIFLIFHISMIIVLISKQKTKFIGPFYNMLKLLFIYDILAYITGFEIRIPEYGLWPEFFQEDKIFATAYVYSVTYLAMLQFCIHVLIPFNRFTLFWFPLHHKKLWSKQWYTAAILIIPAIWLSPIFPEIGKYIYAKENVVLVMLEKPDAFNLCIIILILHCSILTIFAAIFNLLAFLRYYFQKKNLHNNFNQVNEISMLYISCLTFFGHFCYCATMTSRSIFYDNAVIGNIIEEIWIVLTDLIALSGSVSLMILSKNARNTYLKFYLKLIIRKQKITIASSPRNQQLMVQNVT